MNKTILKPRLAAVMADRVELNSLPASLHDSSYLSPRLAAVMADRVELNSLPASLHDKQLSVTSSCCSDGRPRGTQLTACITP